MSKTIREAHRWASSFLQQHDTEATGESHFIAECLLRHVLGWDRARFFACADELLPQGKWLEFQRFIEKKSNGVPLQHMIGAQEFYGRSFCVSADVLIPRPETEELVETVLAQADALWEKRHCVVTDVGTGSGAIAVTLAVERPEWHVTAIDLSAAALDIARKNAKRHGVASRIRFLEGDLLVPMMDRGEVVERPDIVVSNPPYIPTRTIPTLAVEVKDHEPLLALDGGNDGLAVYRRMATMLPRVMKREKGLVALEVGMGQSRHVADMLTQAFPHGEVTILPDLAGIERMVFIQWS